MVGPSRLAGCAAVAGAVMTALVLAGCTATSTTAIDSSSSASSSAALTSAASTSALPTPAATSAAGSPSPSPSPSPSLSTSTSHSPVRIVSTTVTRTKAGATITVGPPKATTEPAATAGECPYLSADVVSVITGQHHGPTQLVDLQPHPMCVFYRSDGGLMGSVRVIEASSPQAAAAAVDQHVPVAGSQPATQPSGWVGGSVSSTGQMTQDSTAKSVYAVSKGNIAVVAEEDESPSIKARVMAVCAIYGLKLQTGQAPDYCSAASG